MKRQYERENLALPWSNVEENHQEEEVLPGGSVEVNQVNNEHIEHNNSFDASSKEGSGAANLVKFEQNAFGTYTNI